MLPTFPYLRYLEKKTFGKACCMRDALEIKRIGFKGQKEHCMRTHYLIILCCAFLGLLSCAEKKPRQENAQAALVPVTVVPVGIDTNLRTSSYVGTVEADKSATLSARYPGRLDSLKVKAGDEVKQGQVLAVISSQSVESSLKMTEATLAQAEDGYRRVLQVHESGSIADVQLVEVQSKLAQARAAAEAARQAAEDCRVKAPFDGVVGDLQIEEGVEVSPLQPLMRVMDISTVKVRFPVPESEIGKLQVGDEAAVEIPALDNHRFRARMMEKGMTASLLSHTYDCKLEPLDSVQGLMPGMVGKVYMDVLYDRGVVIPASTVQMDAQGKYVWVVNPERKVEKRYVEVAGFSGKGVIVSNGFESDDLLIVEGSRKVSTGMQVEVRMAQSAESQSAAKPSEESQSCSKLGKE